MVLLFGFSLGQWAICAVLVFVAVKWAKWLHSRARMYELIGAMPGPGGLPLIGSAYMFKLDRVGECNNMGEALSNVRDFHFTQQIP